MDAPPSAGSALRCNPPLKGGRISLATLAAPTRRLLEAHSRCDRRLYEAALVREAALAREAVALVALGARANATFSVPFHCKASR